jgi:hypothetical protein
MLLATAGLMAGSVVGLSSPANAGPIGSCKSLRSFTLDFRTGGDDLRGNSEVIVWLTTKSNLDIELQHVWGGFGNNTSNSRTVTFQNPNWAINSCMVTGVKIRMVSHPDIFQTADNWNMDGFALYGYSDTGAYSYQISDSTAFKRFTDSNQWWSKLG